jgi:hypothetical protein
VLDLTISILVPHIRLHDSIFAELNKIKVDVPTIHAEIKDLNSTRSHKATDRSKATY